MTLDRSSEQLLKVAVILHSVCRSMDARAFVLLEHWQVAGTNQGERYLRQVAEVTDGRDIA